MQLKKEQLQRQQAILAFVGVYRGACDGIWGPESIRAKREWESRSSFAPGNPNNGLPFGDRDKLPAGMTFSKSERMFKMKGMDDAKLQEIMSRKKSAPAIEVSAPIAPAEAKTTEVKEAAPSQPEIEAKEESSEESKPAQEERKQEGGKHDFKHKHHHRR